MSRKSRRVISRACCEQLESRQLLTVNINGTAGNDTIQMSITSPGGTSQANFTVNGQNVGSTTDPNIVISGLGGNDTITIVQVAFGENVTVAGGAGNDIVNIGNGSFSGDMNGNVYVQENANEGTDALVVKDNASGTGAHPTMRVLADQITTDTGTISHAVHFDSSFSSPVETKEIDFGARADNVSVEAIPPGLKLVLGDGNNTVTYGGPNESVASNGTLAGSIIGGVNTDTVIFDDRRAPTSQYIVYMDKTGVEDQALSSIENVEIDMPSAGLLNMFGDGAITNNLTVNGGYSVISIGNDPPCDVNSMNLNMVVNAPPFSSVDALEILEQDDDGVGSNTMQIYTVGSAQHVDQGNFHLTMNNNLQAMLISFGDTSDTCVVSGTLPGLSMKVLLGGGTNTFTTGNFDGHQNDLDDAFGGPVQVDYWGPEGNDFLNLDDSADATNDGDGTYLISPNTNLGTTSAVSLIKKSNDGSQRDIIDFSTTSYTLTAGSDANAFYIDNPSGIAASINGGAGDDVFYLGGSNPLSADGGSVTLYGGAGTDEMYIDSSTDTAITGYSFSGLLNWSFFNWNVGGTTHTVSYDNTMDLIQLTENTNGTSTNVQSTSSLTSLNIDGNSGNDSFTVGGGFLYGDNMLHVTIAGGAGTDSIELDDHLDSTTSGESEVYNWNTIGITKGPVAIVYSGFESQTLDAAGAGTFNEGCIINVNALNIATTINGSTQTCVVNVAAGDLSTIQSTGTGFFNINLGAMVSDEVNINDNGNSNINSYSLLPTYFWAFNTNTIFNMSNVDEVSINCSQGINGVLVYSTIPSVIVNCNNGDDYVTIGDGVLNTDAPGGVEVDGGGGNDSISFDNHLDTAHETQTLGNGTFTQNTANYLWSSMESVTALEGPGGETLNANVVALPTTVTGNSGADVLNVGGGNLDTNLLANLTFDGAGGTDSLTLNDANDTGNDGYSFTDPSSQNTFNKVGSTKLVLVSNTESETLQANSGANAITVTGVNNMPLIIFGNGGADALSTVEGNVTFDGGAGLDSVNVNTDSIGIATVHFTVSQDLSSVNVHTSGVLSVDQNGGLVVSATSLTLAGRFDLWDNDLVLDYTGATQLANVQTFIKNGRNNGLWNGKSGITSSSAAANSLGITGLGSMEASQWKAIYGTTALFDGISVDSTAVLVKYTYNGDTNFNGQVDGSDFAHIDTNFSLEGSQGNIGGWINGDFDGNGQVDGGDYALIDAAFSAQFGTLRPSAGATPAISNPPIPAPSAWARLGRA